MSHYDQTKKNIIESLDRFYADTGTLPCWAIYECTESVDVNNLVVNYVKLLKDPQIGFASKIEVPIQDVGEYELILTLKLKE